MYTLAQLLASLGDPLPEDKNGKLARLLLCRIPYVYTTMLRSLGKVSGVLLDLSGTLFIDKTPTPGALDALGRLKSEGFPVQFITNTSQESKRLLFSRLQEIGFDVQQDEIFTCLTAARQVIERDGLRPMFLLDPAAMEDFSGVETNNPNCVVLGLAPSCLNYENLTIAFRLMLDGARLIALHKTKYYKKSSGLAIGPGPFVVALEYASSMEAEVMGKPEKTFYLSAQAKLKCQMKETVMIGDDVINDIHGAQLLGMKGILVRTGKYREGDEKSIDPPPHLVCENFAEAAKLILSQR